MGQLQWEEGLDRVIEDAKNPPEYKGGYPQPATLPVILVRLVEKWLAELEEDE